MPRSNPGRRGWKCIWDTGDVDLIDESKSRKSVLIDLRNATLGKAKVAGGYPSSVEGVYGGFTIAHTEMVSNSDVLPIYASSRMLSVISLEIV